MADATITKAPGFTDKAVTFMKENKYISKDSIAGKIVQVLIGLVFVLIVYEIALIVIRSDNLSGNDPYDLNVKKMVVILDGYADSSQLSNVSFNTQLPFISNYKAIIPSSNIKGGAQFTYSLWINQGTTSFSTRRNKCIFIRGDKKKYNVNITETSTNTVTPKTMYVGLCPMLMFGDNENDFVVKFNTVNNIQEQLYLKAQTSDNDLYRKNLISLYSGKWFLMTIVFEDNIPINDFENGLSVQIYINEILYTSGTYSTMLKQNQGDLFFFTDGSIPSCMISAMKYYNYALSQTEIKDIYRAGPSPKSSTTVNTSFISPIMLSDKNRLDIYNA